MKKPSQDLIRRYLEGSGNREEAETVLRWFATPEGQRFYADYLDQKIDEQHTSYENPENVKVDDEQMLSGIYAKIVREEKTSRSIFRYRYAVAAAIVVLLMGSWLAVWLNASETQAFQTAYGEVQHIQLADGSKVVLNANSRLWYQEDQPREVWFEGEAFFEVVHTRDDAPFSVHTSDLVVNVLGTEFNVNTRRRKTDVVLSSGKVKIDLEKDVRHESLMMAPGDKVSYSQVEKSLEKKVVNPVAYTSWTQGTILFDHTPLKEVFQRMEDTYGVSVIVKDSVLLEKEFTGEVVQDLDVMMTLLEKTFEIKLTRKESKIYLE